LLKKYDVSFIRYDEGDEVNKRKINYRGKRPVKFLMFVLVILVGVVTVQISNLYIQNKELEKQALLLEQELQEERDAQERLLEYKEYINTTDYIEQLAREKLGLIKPGEVLFITEDDK
jgi:cell division protein DivIC